MVRFDGVTKRFGDFVAVDRLTLDIHPGEFFALLGPSGCGKTTLLRLLAGFEQPSDGRILLAGEEIGRVPPYRRSVNMMFQSYALFPHLTVAGNIAFGLKQEGLPRAEIRARVAEMLALVKLEAFADRKPERLSGGQRQRVALARSLAKRPKVLLLDEPLAALDKKLREETQFELVDLQDRLGTTFVIVTHDQEEAMTIGDRERRRPSARRRPGGRRRPGRGRMDGDPPREGAPVRRAEGWRELLRRHGLGHRLSGRHVDLQGAARQRPGHEGGGRQHHPPHRAADRVG